VFGLDRYHVHVSCSKWVVYIRGAGTVQRYRVGRPSVRAIAPGLYRPGWSIDLLKYQWASWVKDRIVFDASRHEICSSSIGARVLGDHWSISIIVMFYRLNRVPQPASVTDIAAAATSTWHRFLLIASASAPCFFSLLVWRVSMATSRLDRFIKYLSALSRLTSRFSSSLLYRAGEWVSEWVNECLVSVLQVWRPLDGIIYILLRPLHVRRVELFDDVWVRRRPGTLHLSCYRLQSTMWHGTEGQINVQTTQVQGRLAAALVGHPGWFDSRPCL